MNIDSDLIDLTEEAIERTFATGHQISWLADLISIAKPQPVTVDQRLELATVSNDVIIIDDFDEINSAKKTNNEIAPNTDNRSSITSVTSLTSIGSEKHMNSPSSDSGCFVLNREDVGIPYHVTQADQTCSGNDINNMNVDNVDISLNVNELKDNENASCKLSLDVSVGSISNCSELIAEEHSIIKNTKNSISNDCIATEHLEKVQQIHISIDSNNEQNQNIPTISPKLIDNQTDEPIVDYEIGQTHDENNLLDKSICDVENSRIEKPIDETGQNDNMTLKVNQLLVVNESIDELNENNNKKSLGSQVKDKLSNSKATSIKVVHPTKHVYSKETGNDSNQEPIASLQKHLECSIPLSSINMSSSLFKPSVSNESNSKRLEQIQQQQHSHSDRYDHSNANETQKMLKSKTHSLPNNQIFDRPSVRSTQSSTQNEKQEILFNENESIPSTIMERKTYIKPSSFTTKPINNKTHLQTNTSRQANVVTNKSTMLTADTQQYLNPECQSSTSNQSSVAPSKICSQNTPQNQQQQPYKVYYSGTEIDLGLKDLSIPLSDCVTSGTNPMQSLTSTFCESDNNLLLNTTTKPIVPVSSLPSAIVHPLGLENCSKNYSLKYQLSLANRNNEKSICNDAYNNIISTTNVSSNDERNSMEDQNEHHNHLATSSNNIEDTTNELELKYKPEYMLQIYKELGDHLKILGYRPENENLKTNDRTKRLMNAASILLENDISSGSYSNELNDENDEGDASLPFKKRRKLPVFSDIHGMIKEEDSDSQTPHESPCSVPSVQCEIEIAANSLPSPPMTAAAAAVTTTTTNVNTAITTQSHNINSTEDNNQPIAQCVSYPPTPMLSIANIVEYLPVRAYSTFKTPAPEMTPVRFNIVPQQTMVINQQTPNVNQTFASANKNSNSTSNVSHTQSNQHVEFETTFNILSPQQNIAANQTNPMNGNASTSNCLNVSTETDQFLPSLNTPMQGIPNDSSSSGFNVAPNAAIQYHQAFHSNQPYTTTYSIQPTHNNANNLSPNFDIQNMFNLRNYQMNPQNYHNLMQNSRINLQEKQAILLVNSLTENNQYDSTVQNIQQHQQQQIIRSQPITVDSKSSSTTMNKIMIPSKKCNTKMLIKFSSI